MQKRGQFFLIAALVIIGIVAGLVTIYNTAKTPEEDTTVYDLSDEIRFETSQVIDSGVLTGTNFYGTSPTVSDQIQTLTDFYSSSNPESDLIIVYGDETTLTVLTYKNTDTGSVGVDVGGATIFQEISIKNKYSQTTSRTNPVIVKLDEEITYNFDLRPGQIFYIVIKKENEQERYIAGPQGE